MVLLIVAILMCAGRLIGAVTKLISNHPGVSRDEALGERIAGLALLFLWAWVAHGVWVYFPR